jgi:hypothetical protein
VVYFFSTEQVEMPKIVYNGQKLNKLVNVNTIEIAIKIIPKVPLITFVKNRVTMIADITNLIIPSIFDMFFFILFVFNKFFSRFMRF